MPKIFAVKGIPGVTEREQIGAPVWSRVLREGAHDLRTEGTMWSGWQPLPGPQTLAVECQADELLYGGAAGGGKTDLLIGLALTRHKRSVIFRREYKELQAIVERTRELVGATPGAAYNGQDMLWRLPAGATLEYGAVQHEPDVNKWQGRPHDLKAFDEIPHFTQRQYEFLTTWLRTARRNQRTRVVAAGNPPVLGEGEWVIDYWAPWVDTQYPYPAKPGELRWFARLDNKWQELESSEPFTWKGEHIFPTSRTFIPARLSDNPILMATNYLATVQKLAEPLRSAFLNGDYRASRSDHALQVIPSGWIREAVARWTPRRPRDELGEPWPLAQIGIDVARGGGDRATIQRRYDHPSGMGRWYAPPTIIPGSEVPDGPSMAAYVLEELRRGGPGSDECVLMIDAIGVGSSPFDILRSALGERVFGVNHGARNRHARDRSRKYGFRTNRSEDWWRLREDLDPVYGKQIALPPHTELARELIVPRWKVQMQGIYVESRDDIIERLGNSPDIATGVVLANRRSPFFDRTGTAELDTGASVSTSPGEELMEEEHHKPERWYGQ